jgi:hypothetical protein
MMPALWRDSPNDVRCLCWFSADNPEARAATSDRRVVRTKTRKISSHKTPAAFVLPVMPNPRGQMGRSAAPSFTRTREPAAKSP